MNTADSFARDYDEARGKFVEAARSAGASLEAIAHPLKGPAGGPLYTDVALLGERDAHRVLVMTSGIHGVEAFCGSGAQVDWLRRREFERLPPSTGVLMIHAINPYGFAWLRRVNEDNVDLNRNFLPFGARELPKNAGYRALREALSPSQWDEAAQRAARSAMRAFVKANGQDAFVNAAAGGQYDDAKGIFYGGSRPAWSHETLRAIYDRYLSAARSVCILDYHTGLGPCGFGEQIILEGRGDPAYARARAWFGPAIASLADGKSSAADLSGDNLSVVAEWMPQAEVTAVALEFGTVGPEQTLQALRADNWLHAHGDPLGPDAPAIKAALRDAFYVDRDDWRGMIAGQSLIACRQALAGLSES